LTVTTWTHDQADLRLRRQDRGLVSEYAPRRRSGHWDRVLAAGQDPV